MIIGALVVAGVLRSFSPAGAPQLSFTLTPECNSFRVDAATYSLTPSCAPATGGQHICAVALLGGEFNKRHSVTPCKVVGGVTTCGYFVKEADVQCICNGGQGCPGDLFISPAPVTPTNLTATATSPSEIRLTWDAGTCNSGYIIERATSPDGPFTEIGRIEPQ